MTSRWITGTTAAVSMTFRVLAISVGGYAFTAGCVALSGMALHAMGVPLSDAMLATILLGYVFYIAVVMWGFADRRTLFRPVAILVGAALTMKMSAYLAPGVLGS